MTSLVADLPYSDESADLAVSNGIVNFDNQDTTFEETLESLEKSIHTEGDEGVGEEGDDFISAEEFAKKSINFIRTSHENDTNQSNSINPDFTNQDFFSDENSTTNDGFYYGENHANIKLNCIICNEQFEERENLSLHVLKHLKKPKLKLSRCDNKAPSDERKRGAFAKKRVRPYNNKTFISQVIEPEVNPDNPNFPAVPKLRILLPSQLSQQVDDAIENSKNQNMRPPSTSSNSSFKSEMVPNDSPSFHSQTTELSSNFWDNGSHTSSDSGIQIREIRESGEKEVERHDSLLQNFLNDTVSSKEPPMILPGPADTEFISLDRLAGPQCQMCGERFVDKPSFDIHCKATGHYNNSPNSHNSLVPFGGPSMLSNPLESLSNLSMSQLAQSVNRMHQNGPPVQQNVMINIQQFGHQMPQKNPYEMPPHMGQHPMYPPSNPMYHPMGPHPPPHVPPMGHYPQMPPHASQYPSQYPQYPPYYPGGGAYSHAPPRPPPPQHGPPHAPPPVSRPQAQPQPQIPSPNQQQGSMMPPRPPPPRMPQSQPRTPPQQVRPPVQRAPAPRERQPAPMMRAGPPVRAQLNQRMQNPQTRPVGPRPNVMIKRNGTPPNQNNTDVKKKRMDVLVPDRNDNDDCHVISMQKCNDGLPVIKNVQGATSTSAADPIVHLTDSITLSVRNPKEAPPKEAPQPAKKNDAKAVANILATRGITVTPAVKSQKETPSTTTPPPKPQPVAINLNSAVSIIPTAKTQNGQTPQSKTEKPPTVDLTDDEPAKQQQPQLQSQSQSQSQSQQVKRSLPYTCDLCPAQYPTMKSLMTHRRQYHKAGPHGELGIPIIDLSQPTVLAKLQSLGIQNYIPLPQSGTNGTFGMPIVSVNGARNPSVCNLGALGSGAVLTLGPLHRLNNLPVNTNKQ